MSRPRVRFLAIGGLVAIGALGALVLARALSRDGARRAADATAVPAAAISEATEGAVPGAISGRGTASGTAEGAADTATGDSTAGRSPGVGRSATAVASPAAPGDVFAVLRAEPPARDLVDLATRMGRVAFHSAVATPAPPPAYRVGDASTFWLHDINSEQYFTVTARLESLAPNAYLWVQSDRMFDRAGLESGAAGFSDTVYPRVREVFGSEWTPGVDGDPRLHILHHEPIAGIAGYFYSADEYPVAVEPHSNQREMFYINLDATTPGAYDYLALLAHEFQHMIHFNHDRDEAAWVNEGLSELAAHVAGYPMQNGNLFMNQPDVPLLEWQHVPGANAPHYAAAYAFFAYLRQRYGDAVIRAVVAAPPNGPAGIEAALAAVGEPQAFEGVFGDWVVANVVHADANGEAGARFGYGDLVIGEVDPEPLPAGGTAATVGQYATDYYDVTERVADGRLALAFDGDTTIGLLDPVPARPGAIWWSGRGDNMDARLTRTFDLTGLETASLTFRLWYGLEDNWDYAYFLASRDGGRTWERLPTARTTDANPNGNNFGRGLTGESGTWVGETVDLSPFTGGPVTLRFEVVTDDAVNLAGVALDDIRLDAVGFADDAEADAGWLAEGWRRLDPLLPQRWGVQVIVESPAEGVATHPVDVGPDGRAGIDVAGIPPDATVTLAVSALTPATRHAGGYRVDG